MQHWLVKQEPEDYSWDDFVRDGKTDWEGVRNYQARNNPQKMKIGDQVLFYHSVKPRTVVGIAEVSREAFPDATADDPRWVAAELKPVRPLAKQVSLDEIKATPSLSEVALIKQSRLSVMPLEPKEFQIIIDLGA
jgi:predicted RNA-binding protein with PUA-like domain